MRPDYGPRCFLRVVGWPEVCHRLDQAGEGQSAESSQVPLSHAKERPQEQDIPAKFSVFSASAGRETAKVLEEAEHGLFSYYMMKGLEGEADANSDNQITNGELIAFINKNVSRQANQTPQLNGNPDQILVQW